MRLLGSIFLSELLLLSYTLLGRLLEQPLSELFSYKPLQSRRQKSRVHHWFIANVDVVFISSCISQIIRKRSEKEWKQKMSFS